MHRVGSAVKLSKYFHSSVTRLFALHQRANVRGNKTPEWLLLLLLGSALQYLQMLKIIFQGDRKTDNLYNN